MTIASLARCKIDGSYCEIVVLIARRGWNQTFQKTLHIRYQQRLVLVNYYSSSCVSRLDAHKSAPDTGGSDEFTNTIRNVNKLNVVDCHHVKRRMRGGKG
jgi:hypothetical protein